MKKNKKWWFITIALILAIAIYLFIDNQRVNVQGKVVVCIPVYGQSLALGEEAERVTDFNDFVKQTDDRVITENIDHKFGYFESNSFKKFIKKLFRHRKRAFELSVYGMSESLVQHLGKDTIICTFPGGQGATALADLSKGTAPYNLFVADIAKANKLAKEGGATFVVPAICWMQGESDIADYPDTDYKELLLKFRNDINQDIKSITGQKEDVRLICYQTNAVSKGERFQEDSFECVEAKVPQTFVDLLREDTLFWASGPTYHYNFVREYIHIDAIGQKRIGHLAAKSALGILHHQPRLTGLIPTAIEATDSDVVIRFHIPCPPLALDTITVQKAKNYGFKIIQNDDIDIAESVSVEDSLVRIKCTHSPVSCRVRYAINGAPQKSGPTHGPRGNLRDSQGLYETVVIAGQTYPQHNWCFQFDEIIP